jgi:cytochrome c2
MVNLRSSYKALSDLFTLTILLIFLSGCSALPVLLNRQSAYEPALVGDAERGENIFKLGINDSPPCSTCHQFSESSYSLGIAPSLIGVSERAGQRIQGVSAEDYLRDSILDPQSFVVTGFTIDMFRDYREYLNEQDIADLIAFLMGI